MDFSVVFFLFALIPATICQNYSLEDKLLPFISHNEINLKFLKNVILPEFGMSRIHPYDHLPELNSIIGLNTTSFYELLFDGLKMMNDKTRYRNYKCSDDLVQIIFNLDSFWAFQMLDASGKLASGLSLGATTWPGSYRECKSIYSPLDQDGHGNFHGKYCIASWDISISKFPQLDSISTGICVPDSCHDEDVMIAISNVLHLTGQIPFLKKYRSVLKLGSITCKTAPKSPDAAVIIYAIIVSSILFLVFLGSSLTAYKYFVKSDVSTPLTPSSNEPRRNSNLGYGSIQTSAKSEQLLLEHNNLSHKTLNISEEEAENYDNEPSKMNPVPKQKRSWKSFLLCFSAISNAEKILEVKSNNTQLQSIHGIRFLSLTWVILGHTYITAAIYISNKLEVLEDLDSFSFQMVLQSPFSVDSFFLLSGLLLTYLFLKEAEKKGKINWLYFYLHRIWRLTPVYFLVVAFYMLVFKYMGSGPFWNENYGDSCRHTWWYYLLYLNNFIPIKQMCVGWSWYLANDMQFYVISPLFLYFLWKYPKIGISIILSLLAGSCIAIGVLSSVHDIKPFLAGVTEVKDLKAYEDKMWNSFDIIYDKPYCRIGPYLIGSLCGYLLCKVGDKKKFLSPWHQLYGWIGAAFYSCIVIFGTYHAELLNSDSAMYNALSRSAYSVGLSWLIFACETGHAGLIGKFLSMKFWVPLSRLTYCAYLVHPILIHHYYMGLKTALYFTHLTMVIYFFGFLIISYVFAFLVSICFESPMMNIEKLFLKK